MISSNFYIVAIGSSAGGMKALREFFTHLGPTEGMAFVIVSHLPNNREARRYSRVVSWCFSPPALPSFAYVFEGCNEEVFAGYSGGDLQ